MIEKRIKNELTLKRWKRFKARKSASWASILFLICTILTFMAPMLANNKPIILHYKNNTYFPVLKDYSAKVFGITDSMVVDFRHLKLDKGDWGLWPIYQWNPFESNQNVDSYPSEPSSKNLWGTDESGRDVLARVLYGFKYSILYAALVWFLSFIIGVVLGGVMGYFGGKIDMLGQRMVEIFSTVPQFFLLLILVSIFTPNLYLLVAISSLFGWIHISYYVRAEFLKNRKREFVEAAVSMGASSRRVIFKHILPNSLTPVITFSPFVISGHIIGLASLDYLGFGLPIPTPSWGELLSQAQKHFTTSWWLAVYPSVALFVTLTLLNLIGEGIRDALDPKMTL